MDTAIFKERKYEMGYLRDRAEKAQNELFAIVLEFFKMNPDKSFTNKDLREKLGIFRGGYNDNFSHGLLGELENRGHLEKVSKGFRLKIQGRENRQR